jgi:hypothetical protein
LTFPIVWNYKQLENNILEAGLFPSSGEWRETSTLLGPLEAANLNLCSPH